MNKKQIESVAEQYLNFIIETPLYTSRALNTNEIEFFSEGLLKIKGKMESDVFIQTKDIKIIRGVGKL
jgi:hypothetical protein